MLEHPLIIGKYALVKSPALGAKIALSVIMGAGCAAIVYGAYKGIVYLTSDKKQPEYKPVIDASEGAIRRDEARIVSGSFKAELEEKEFSIQSLRNQLAKKDAEIASLKAAPKKPGRIVEMVRKTEDVFEDPPPVDATIVAPVEGTDPS